MYIYRGNSFPGFGLFSFSQIMACLMFLFVAGMIVWIIARGIAQWNRNNHSPRLTVPACVISKRTNVSSHRHGGNNGLHHHHTSTTYYITFQVESGDRMEFCVSGAEYGMVVEGDRGRLTFQGTRYLGFARE